MFCNVLYVIIFQQVFTAVLKFLINYNNCIISAIIAKKIFLKKTFLKSFCWKKKERKKKQCKMYNI